MWGKKLLPKISQIGETSIYRVIRLCIDAMGEMLFIENGIGWTV